MCGETWCFVTAFSGAKNLTRITDLFWGDSRFGNWLPIRREVVTFIQRPVKAIVPDQGSSLTLCRAVETERLQEPGYDLQTTPGMKTVPTPGAAAD